jgi:hypothetical protein
MSVPYRDGGVGHCGIGGSPDAAVFKEQTVEDDRAAVFRVVHEAGARGIMGDNIAKTLGWLPYRVRPRTSDLRKAGLIFDSQRREKNANGIGCIVWVGRDFAGPVVIGDAA